MSSRCGLGAHSSDHLELFFSLACAKEMKQSRGIKINAVITALRATQNQDNSRRLASHKKMKILITLLHLHSS